MRQYLLLSGILILGLALLLALSPVRSAHALPEYSAQTGEPCATCHISPSGGGPRGPRGQAWVGRGKPGAVPGLLQSLEILGVEIAIDPADYQAASSTQPAPDPLPLEPAQIDRLNEWLTSYDGN